MDCVYVYVHVPQRGPLRGVGQGECTCPAGGPISVSRTFPFLTGINAVIISRRHYSSEVSGGCVQRMDVCRSVEKDS